jgi:hypothetical protein
MCSFIPHIQQMQTVQICLSNYVIPRILKKAIVSLCEFSRCHFIYCMYCEGTQLNSMFLDEDTEINPI